MKIAIICDSPEKANEKFELDARRFTKLNDWGLTTGVRYIVDGKRMTIVCQFGLGDEVQMTDTYFYIGITSVDDCNKIAGLEFDSIFSTVSDQDASDYIRTRLRPSCTCRTH